jgi:transcriptional regulator with XRE-family HTH domain
MPDPRAQEFGSRLRQSREAKGVSLRRIADVTKLSVHTFEALERGDVRSLPRGIFRRALVRAYAQEVGLEPERTLTEFLDLCPDDLPSLVTAPGGARMLADDVPPSRAQRFGQMALRVLGAVIPLAAGAVYITLAIGAPHQPSPLLEAEPIHVADTWRPEIVPAGGFVEPPPPAPRALVFVLTITEPCDLQVEVDGREILARQFTAGEQVRVEAQHEVVLTGNSAGAVQFSVNGQAGRMLGARGEPLGARITRDGYDALLIGH